MNPTISQELAKELTRELVTLSKLQTEAMQGAAYIPLSAEESKEYDQRQNRSREICTLLQF